MKNRINKQHNRGRLKQTWGVRIIFETFSIVEDPFANQDPTLDVDLPNKHESIATPDCM